MYKMNILIILLGSNINYLLKDRIDIAINFVNKFNKSNIDWFLSGGIKNPDLDTISEAEKMSNEIKKVVINESTENKWNYIFDTEATNTAENFIMAGKFLNENNKYDEVYIVTSSFHYERANKIAEKILNVKPKWILGYLELDDSIYWEKIHIRNVESDIKKAIDKFS